MRTLLHANSMGSLAASAIPTAGAESIVGSIVIAFPNSFYVKTIKDELIFITNRQLKSPITINLDSSATLEQIVKPLQPVSVVAKEIHLGDTATIDISTIPHNNTSSPENSFAQQFKLTQETLNLSSAVLAIINTSQSVLDPNGFAHEGIKDFVRNGIIPLREVEKQERFIEAAMKIVGLGSGFTPSGDDVIGGFLSTYNSFTDNVNRGKIILDLDLVQQRTNWISAKLMDYMQHQVLDDHIQQLIRSAESGSESEFVIALETLLPRGHTSGIDISVGALLATCLISDLKMNERGTERITKRIGLN